VNINKPLIVVCGFPCCGKTTFAVKLYEYLVQQCGCADNVFLVNEESENISKRTGYADSFQEKISRGVLKSAVNTKLDKKSYVILDSLNYIKGYRYELYCIARCILASCDYIAAD
jgi:protein KTI12